MDGEVALADLTDGSQITYGIVQPGRFLPSGVGFLRGGDIADGRIKEDDLVRIAPEIARPYGRSELKGGELVISLVANPGEVAIVPAHLAGFNVARNVGIIRVNERLVDPRFLFLVLRAPLTKARLLGFAVGSVQSVVNLAQLREFKVALPSRDQQLSIAELLGALDDKIELNRRTAETLEATGRALFKSWFVDFDPVKAKREGRATGLPDSLAALFPDGFGPGSLPEGWTTLPLGDVAVEIETGSRPKGVLSGYYSGVPSIGAESIVGIGKFNFSKTRFVPEEFFHGLSRGKICDRDILLYKDGGRPGLFEPHVTMVGEGFPFERAAINEHVYRLKASSDYGQELLFLALSSDGCMEEMRMRGTGVAIPGLNSTQIRQISMPGATSPVRSAFGRIVSPLLTRILVLSSQSMRLAQLRDTLLPKLISGEFRIRDAERAVAAA